MFLAHVIKLEANNKYITRKKNMHAHTHKIEQIFGSKPEHFCEIYGSNKKFLKKKKRKIKKCSLND